MYTKRKIFALVCGVLLVVSIGLNIGLLNQNQNLREQMNQLQSAQIQMTMRINDLSGEISDLSAQLTAENSLLADSEVTVEIDADKHLTADISVIPKEIGLEDSVYIVIGDDWEQALPSGAAYTARLSLDPNSVSVLPYVVLQAADGTQRQEALDEIWLDSYFQLLYAYDLSCSGGQITVSIGLQTGGDCALSIPEDVKGIWITSASGSDVAMEPDGARIPDAAGMDSEVTVAAPDSSSTAADLYYYYYTAVLDYPEGGSLQLTCVLKTDGQARYTIDLGSVQSQEIGGSGSVYPEWE